MRSILFALPMMAGLCAAPSAMAGDGYPPFFGYSTYFGGPTTYFTPESDVQQATTIRGYGNANGYRTYYRGGPFWAYRSNRRMSYSGHRDRRVVLRRKG